MIIKRPADVRPSEITDEQLYLRRREFIRLAGGAALGAAAVPFAGGWMSPLSAEGQSPLAGVKEKVVTTDEKLNSLEEITGYNNFYEFGLGKDDPAALRRTHEDEPVESEDRRPLRQAGRVPASRI